MQYKDYTLTASLVNDNVFCCQIDDSEGNAVDYVESIDEETVIAKAKIHVDELEAWGML